MKTNLFLDTVNFLLFPIFIVGTAINSCCTPVLDDLITTIIDDCKKLTLAQLQQLQIEIDQIITIKKEEKQDRRLESAILALAEKCDGAIERDGKGFSGCDAKFGHYLANQIKITGLNPHQAKVALIMLNKYSRQLTKIGITLPTWSEIEYQYQYFTNANRSDRSEKLPEKRLELVEGEIALFSPYDAWELPQIKAISNKRKPVYVDGSFSHWAFFISEINAVIKYARDRKFAIAEDILALEISHNWEKQEEERLAKEQAEQDAFFRASELLKILKNAGIDRPLPDGRTLFYHQQKAVEWLIAHRKGGIYNGGILADHMGLGKTLSALVAAKVLKQYYNCPVFVVCPPTLKQNWLNEAASLKLNIEVYSWAKMPHPPENQEYILIADEAHYAQNRRSKRATSLINLANDPNCRATWLLTGTPIKNGKPVNLFPLLEAIGHPLSENRKDYELRYCYAQYGVFGWDTTGATHLNELAQKTEGAILRRTKAECLDLPTKNRIKVLAEVEPKLLKQYQAEIAELVQEYRDRVAKGEVAAEAQALVTLGILRKIGSKYKTASAIALTEELLEQDQQVVVFTEFKESAKTIYERFSGCAEILTGDTPQKDRQETCNRFQSGQSKVFVGTIKAGGVGITLTSASNVILVDRPWTPGDAEQAEDRCHRIGQSQSVFSYWLQLDMIDHKIDQLIEEKQVLIEKVLTGKIKTFRLDSVSELAKELLDII